MLRTKETVASTLGGWQSRRASSALRRMDRENKMQAPSKPPPAKPKKKAGKKKNAGNSQRQQPKAPVAIGTVARVPRPKIEHTKNGKCQVRHSELVGDINGTTAFTTSTYPINAGLSNIFVWLSSLALNYESYKFRKLRFRYIPACATTQVGFVYFAIEYDSSDSSPTSEQQLATYDGCVYGSPWVGHDNISSKMNLTKRNSYFARAGTLPSTADINLYDTGYLIVATVGNGGTPALGKLWVDYEVELSTPQLGVIGIGKSLSASYVGADFFTTSPTVSGNAPLTVSLVTNTSITLTSTQQYQGSLNIAVAGGTITNLIATGTATTTTGTQVINAAATSAIRVFEVNWVAPGQTFILTVTAASVSAYTIRVGQYDVAN